MNRVKILDTTLREGEQTPGVSFTLEQKLGIAHMLDDFGVDYIEVGHPAVSDDIHEAVRRLASENLDAKILAHSRCMRSDIDHALDCGVEWVGMFFCVSDKSLEQRFRKSKDEAVRLIQDSVEYAKDHGLSVRYTLEDTVRSDFDTTVRVGREAIDAGADRLCIADTTGAMTPTKMLDFVRRFREQLPGIEIETHCHNDLGLAVANSLAGVEAGASVVATCVNGLGERAGITSLAEVCSALHFIYNVENNWNLKLLPTLSNLVESFSGIRKSPQAPITGETAFTHNAGLHVSAVIQDPTHYENIQAEDVGRERKIAVSKFSGRNSLEHHLKNGDLEEILNIVKNGGNNGNHS